MILLEWVKGLLSSKGSANKRGEVFYKFLGALETVSYTPKRRVVLAADYGVPQLCERIFVVVTSGRNDFLFSKPTHAPLEECNGFSPQKPQLESGKLSEDWEDQIQRFEEKRSTKGSITMWMSPPTHPHTLPRELEGIAQVPEGSYLAG